MLRGAPISDEEKKELNLKAGRLIKSRGIKMYDLKEFDEIRGYGYFGYANYFSKNSWDKSKLEDKADVPVYKQLLEIDSKLGTTPSEQLFGYVFSSLRMDLIKV